jgi:hypothetical protein
MGTRTSWSTKDGSRDRWSLIREEDFNTSVSPLSKYTNWYVKGPTGLYPFGEDEARARTCLNAKVGVPNATPFRHDEPPVVPDGPLAPDSTDY